ncbi:hypothetical protein HHI36_014055 [Cryptolaemus montrouzieri]|uniref:Uncharacterized protein n=1 Tax=Cryptolaemus montrouzieri TaxID=559131 RepID=A0ABD2N257_9CUCU
MNIKRFKTSLGCLRLDDRRMRDIRKAEDSLWYKMMYTYNLEIYIGEQPEGRFCNSDLELMKRRLFLKKLSHELAYGELQRRNIKSIGLPLNLQHTLERYRPSADEEPEFHTYKTPIHSNLYNSLAVEHSREIGRFAGKLTEDQVCGRASVWTGWQEYFRELFQNEILDGVDQPTDEDEDVTEDSRISSNPSIEPEITHAIREVKNGKSPGEDHIPVEVIKVNPAVTTNTFHYLFKQIWNSSGFTTM